MVEALAQRAQSRRDAAIAVPTFVLVIEALDNVFSLRVFVGKRSIAWSKAFGFAIGVTKYPDIGRLMTFVNENREGSDPVTNPPKCEYPSAPHIVSTIQDRAQP